VHPNEYSRIFALSPWTLSAATDIATHAHPNDIINFTVTSAIQQTNPLQGGDNKVQVVMDNGDKVLLSYSSLNSSSDSIWTGSYTLPSNTTDGSHTYTVEAAQPFVETDVTTHFDSAPASSNNTGITLSQSFTVDNPVPSSFSLVSPSGDTTETKPTLIFKKATDINGIASYEVSLDYNKTKSYITGNIPSSADTSKSVYKWKDDNDVKVEFANENDTDANNDEIRVYFKALNSNPLSEGNHSWKVTAKDSSGGSREETKDFTIVKSIPSSPTPTPTKTKTKKNTLTPISNSSSATLNLGSVTPIITSNQGISNQSIPIIKNKSFSFFKSIQAITGNLIFGITNLFKRIFKFI